MDTEKEFEAFSNLTDIQNFFYGQTVFLTGVTGLVGKVVLEKILRCCPGVGMVYIHMRNKKNLNPEERFEKILKLELFRELKKILPQFHKKIQVVSGDISLKRLGMSFEDYEKIQQNVSIVISSAASVNFKDPIKVASDNNLLSTKYLLDLCHGMPHLKAFIHVSTAFVQREPDGSVYEEIPKCKVAPDRLLDVLEWADENTQKAIEDHLTGKILTTYLVTKALAENFIDEHKGDLPVAIVRPAYISPTYEDPFAGWIDQLQGISGLLLAGAKGVLRALVSVRELKINVVPVDIVTNTILASAWHVGTTKPAPLFIVNCVLNYDKLPYADEEVLQFALKKRSEYPLASFYRYPHFTIYYSNVAYNIHALIDEWIPAFFVDLFLYITTGRTILFKVYRKIHFLYSIFYKLGRSPWVCRRENYHFLTNRLSEEDAKIFFMDTENFDWPRYLEDCFKGGRKFLAREDPSNIPYAKRKAFIWYTVTTALKWLIILYFFYYLFTSSFFTPLYESIGEKFHSISS